MKIDHIAMYVTDLEATRDFFVRYFRKHAFFKIIYGLFKYHSYDHCPYKRLRKMEDADKKNVHAAKAGYRIYCASYTYCDDSRLQITSLFASFI